jgi:hypothetical protein
VFEELKKLALVEALHEKKMVKKKRGKKARPCRSAGKKNVKKGGSKCSPL